MQVLVDVTEQFVRDAEARGLSPKQYAEQFLPGAAERRVAKSPLTVREAVEGIKSLREGNELKGLSIKSLITEGRKY